MFLKICDTFRCFYKDPVISSILSTIIIICITRLYTKYKNKRIYGKIEGKYKGYDIGKDNYISEQVTSGIVKHIKNNICQLIVRQFPDSNEYVWIGIITFETENTGTITWKYTRFGNEDMDKKVSIGIKRIIVDKDKNKYDLYIIEDNIDNQNRFSKQVFKQV